MNIKTKLTEQDFINASLVLFYSKLSTKIITGIGVFFLCIEITLTFLYSQQLSISQFIGPLIVLGGFPLVNYFSAKRNYNSNQTIGETIEYQFDEDFLYTVGESFNAQVSWDKIYKVTETTNWIFIWHNRQMANPVPRKDLRAGQIAELKEFLNLHQVKNNLS